VDGSLFRGAIEHPSHAKTIFETAPVGAPEHVLERHLNLAALSEGGEQAIRFGASVGFEIDIDVVALVQLEAHRIRRIGAHDHMTAQDG